MEFVLVDDDITPKVRSSFLLTPGDAPSNSVFLEISGRVLRTVPE